MILIYISLVSGHTYRYFRANHSGQLGGFSLTENPP